MASRLQPWPAALSFTERWATAKRAADTLRAQLRGNPNVLKVEPGLEREARANRNALVTLPGFGLPDDDLVPCVQIQVRRKWTTRARRRGAFPDSVPRRVKVGGLTVLVRIPVDVIEAPRNIELHAGRMIASSNDAGDRITGTSTCFVQAKGVAGPLLMSCHHVLALTRDLPFPQQKDYLEIAAEVDGAVKGHLVALPLNPAALDVALASFGGKPSNVITSGDQQVRLTRVWRQPDIPIRFLIATHRGVLRASLITREAQSFSYFGGATQLHFDDVLVSTVEEDHQQMRPGDSGAPLFLSDGTLIGLHFAGERGGSPYSYALRADRMFESFAKPLRLWPS